MKRGWSFARIVLDVLLIVVIFTLIGLRLWVYRPVEVVQESMLPTLEPGDRLMVKTWRAGQSAPPRGAVVVLQPPGEDEWVVKRVIGVPGDRIAHGRRGLRLNGEPVSEPYVRPFQERFWAEVPPETIYVLGDNRPQSNDSRDYGPVPIERVIGEAVAVFAPGARRRWLEPAAELQPEE